jgi:hypothetical protein
MHGFVVDLPGGVTIDLQTHILTTPRGRYRMHAQQARLLAALADVGQVKAYSDLIRAVGSFSQPGTKSYRNLLFTVVWRLRLLLNDVAPHLQIACEPRVGYFLLADCAHPGITASAAIALPTSRAVSSLVTCAAGESLPAADFSGGNR